MRSNVVDLRRDGREYTMETLLLKAIFFEHDGYIRFQRELYKVSTWKRHDEDDVKNVFNALEACKLVKKRRYENCSFFKRNGMKQLKRVSLRFNF